MKRLIYALIILLVILHQDFWWWDDSETLLFGFVPIGLAYHAAVSIAAAVLWAMAVRYCWPKDVDADEPPTDCTDNSAARTSQSSERKSSGKAAGSWETSA